MKTLLLISTMILVAYPVHGQDIQYRGETSQGGRIEFLLTTRDGQRCVAQLQGSLTLDCPLGQTVSVGYGIGVCFPLQEDGSFSFEFPRPPVSQFAISGRGRITNDGAEGGLGSQLAALTFLKDPDCQVCDAGDVTWTASPVRSPGLAKAIEPDGFDVFLSVDKKGKTSIQYSNLQQ